MNEKQLTLKDITMGDVYDHITFRTHLTPHVKPQSSKFHDVPCSHHKPYFITAITEHNIQYCVMHDITYHAIPLELITKPLSYNAMILLYVLAEAEIANKDIKYKLYSQYQPYIPILQFQMDIEQILKNDLFYAPFDSTKVEVLTNPMGTFVKEVKHLQGTGRKGVYYDDEWDDETYNQKVHTFTKMSKELYNDQKEISISKQGQVSEIQTHLYQLQQLLPSMTALQTYDLRELCLPYSPESMVFTLYRNCQNKDENPNNQIINDYLWYFASHDDKYRQTVKTMPLDTIFKELCSITTDTTVEEGFALLAKLATKLDYSPFSNIINFSPLHDYLYDVYLKDMNIKTNMELLPDLPELEYELPPEIE